MARPPYQFKQQNVGSTGTGTPVVSNEKIDDTIYDVRDFSHKIHDFFATYGKIIYGVLGGLAFLIVAYLGYNFLYKGPNEQKASEKSFKAEQMMSKDSFEIALAGRPGSFDGLLDIADHYGGTSAGNMAKYYIGVASLQKGQWDDAIRFLEDYSPAGTIMPALTEGLIGDAYSEKGDMEKALSQYKSAISESENDFTTPYYLWKAGMLCEHLGKLEDAKAMFERLKSDFPSSEQGKDAEMHLARISN
jgi:TolA-binding protein